MSRWRRHKQIWCNWPTKPIGLIEVIGGSYLSASSHISYKYLLDSLAKKGLAIHTWNYLPSLDHQAQANEVWREFRACKKILEKRIGLKIISLRLGHSLGCKLHLLAPDGGRNCNALILISFNNFTVKRSIPAIGKISEKLKLETEFSPSPKETMRLIYKQHFQTNNLIITFSNDNLDQSLILLKCLKERGNDATECVNLSGTHTTPISTGLRHNVLGQWATDKEKIKNLNILIEEICSYSKTSLSS